MKVKRDKKSDKQKRKQELNGGFSQVHVRLQEQLKENQAKKKGKRG